MTIKNSPFSDVVKAAQVVQVVKIPRDKNRHVYKIIYGKVETLGYMFNNDINVHYIGTE